MRRANNDESEQPGQDSFIDVVTNIVGILIMLVMVMGLRTSKSVESGELADARVASTAPMPDVSEEELQAAVQDAVSKGTDVRKLVGRVVQVREETLLRREERGYLATFVAEVQQDLERRRAELSEKDRQDFDVRRRLADAQQTLDELTREKVSLVTRMPETDITEVECLPTPLAQTVSGTEVHLRLAHGHVAVIPLDRLRKEFETQAERDVWRLRNQDDVVSTVGPIDGFRLRYRLAKDRVTVQQQPGIEQQATVVRFVVWELLPASTQLGEPTDQALLPDSDLRRTLHELSPDSTTVTIWTYPDSFTDFRKLKQTLFEMGYATAGRPLPQGVLIGGSPHGTKSAAQ
jgi:hypothetical protein